MKNRKGFTGVEIIVLVAVACVGFFFAGPNIGKGVHNIFQGDKNKTKITSKVTESYPMFYKDKEGNFIPSKVPYMKTEENFNSTTEKAPETLWEKFWRMGAMAVIIIVILSYLGLWPIITLWWNNKIKPKIEATKVKLADTEEEMSSLKGDAKLIVTSVDEGLAAMNTEIAAAQASFNNAQAALNSAALIEDPALRAGALANAQNLVARAMSILEAVTKMKTEFITAMSRKQDTTTKMLVSELKND